MPKYVQNCGLAILTRDLIFSYSVTEGSVLYRFCALRLTWDTVAYSIVQGRNFTFKYSQQFVVAHDLNRLYFMGGAEDENFDRFSKQTLQWDVASNTMCLRAEMLSRRIDFGCCYANREGGRVYLVKGFKEIFQFQRSNSTHVYGIRHNKWEELPNLDSSRFPGLRCQMNLVNNKYIYAFFHTASIYGRIDIDMPLKEQTWESLNVKGSPLPFLF
jgi:hypothetical protein